MRAEVQQLILQFASPARPYSRFALPFEQSWRLQRTQTRLGSAYFLEHPRLSYISFEAACEASQVLHHRSAIR